MFEYYASGILFAVCAWCARTNARIEQLKKKPRWGLVWTWRFVFAMEAYCFIHTLLD